jgi:hypothetical protein
MYNYYQLYALRKVKAHKFGTDLHLLYTDFKQAYDTQGGEYLCLTTKNPLSAP